MQVRIRSWCCQLSTFVTVVAIIQTVVYLVIASLTVAWVVLPYTETVLPPTMDSYLWLGQSYLRQSVTVLIISLGVSFSGILCSSLLLVGVRTQSRYLLVPWVVLNVLVLLVLFVTGSYLVMFFTLLKDEKDYVLAAMSSSLLLLSMFLVFITILVVQLFIKMKQKQHLVRVASSIRGSRASINYKYNTSANTPVSVKSSSSGYKYQHSHETPLSTQRNISVQSGNRLGKLHNYKSNSDTPNSIRSNRSVQSVNRSKSRKRKTHLSDQHGRSYQPHRFVSKHDPPKHRSRSLEYILDSSPSNSSMDDYFSQLKQSGGIKSLPRLRPSTKYPHLYQGEHPSPFHTDTIRSSKSVTSSKSVSIHPRVTEYYYTHNKKKSDEDREEFEYAEVVSDDSEEGSVPAPIFPAKKDHDDYFGEGDFIL